MRAHAQELHTTAAPPPPPTTRVPTACQYEFTTLFNKSKTISLTFSGSDSIPMQSLAWGLCIFMLVAEGLQLGRASMAPRFDRKNLTDPMTAIYMSYGYPEILQQWLEYGAFYNEHLHHMRRGRRVTMLEIGVEKGGSTRIWEQYFENLELSYVGIDINKRSKTFARPPRIHIEIGSVDNPKFLSTICKHYGPFDLIGMPHCI